MDGRSVWIAVAVAMALSLIGGAPAGSQDGRDVRFVTITTGAISGVREPARLVVRDPEAWRGLWRRHTQGADSPLPPVDFGREMVIGVFAGASPGRVTIHRVTREAGRLVVGYSVRERRPLPDGEGVPPSTAFHIIRLARSPLPVEFSVLKLPQVY
jgi:hypothetical protein